MPCIEISLGYSCLYTNYFELVIFVIVLTTIGRWVTSPADCTIHVNKLLNQLFIVNFTRHICFYYG